MYLFCDGTLTIDLAGVPACDSWVATTEPELLGKALLAHKLTVDDFNALAALTFAILLAAYGVRMVRNIFLPDNR